MPHSVRTAVAIAFVLMTAVDSRAQTLPTVAILATGGTIASRHDPAKGGYVPAVSADELVEAVPGLRTVARIQTEQISNISSSDMTPEIWLRLAARVSAWLERPDVAGVVVTHGTNTLEETAFFLDLTVAGDNPVVLVGAQRPASDPDADGPRNLLDAVRVAAAPQARGKGTLVVMNGQINAARDVTKTNTSQVETFRSLEFGALGLVDVESVRFYRSPLRPAPIPIQNVTAFGRVDIVPSYAGADGRLVRALVRDGNLSGLVIAGLGLGGVPAEMFDAIQEARAQGLPVVVGTRVPTGRVFPLSATKGSALSLKEIGCVLADTLSPQKARVLLMLALTQTRDPKALQAFFNR